MTQPRNEATMMFSRMGDEFCPTNEAAQIASELLGARFLDERQINGLSRLGFSIEMTPLVSPAYPNPKRREI